MIVMLILLGAVTIANLGVELTTGASTRSFRVHGSDSLFDLVQVEQASLRDRFDIYLLLKQVGGERTVIAPPGYLISDRLDGLSDMTLETDATGGPSLTAAQVGELLTLPGLEGSFDLGDESVERALYVVDPSPAERVLRLIVTDTHAIVVGESVLDSVVSDG